MKNTRKTSKIDMETVIRNEMLFIRASLCSRYNGIGNVYSTNDTILSKVLKLSKHPVEKFDALVGQCVKLPDCREILLYPLKPTNSDECACIVYVQITNDEGSEAIFSLSGNFDKDHDVFVKIHEWTDEIIKKNLLGRKN